MSFKAGENFSCQVIVIRSVWLHVILCWVPHEEDRANLVLIPRCSQSCGNEHSLSRKNSKGCVFYRPLLKFNTSYLFTVYE